MSDYLTKRNGKWQYVRRVPTEFEAVDPRGIVKLSTKVKISADPRGIKAARVADRLNKATEKRWKDLTEGRAAAGAGDAAEYKAAQRLARDIGFDYVEAGELATRSAAEVVERVLRLDGKGLFDQPAARSAVLGGAAVPQILLSTLLEEFEGLTVTERIGMSEQQITKWRAPKERAIRNLTELRGDKPITELTRLDAMELRRMWQDRILDDEIEPATANKDFNHLNRMLKEIERRHQIPLGPIFAELSFKRSDEVKRPPYKVPFVEQIILRPGALDGMNQEERNVMYVIAETGMRPSEIVNLTRKHIHLDANIPYVEARPDGRRMKTPQSKRDIPLVGLALEAMREQRDGFPRYRHKADTLSNTVNKYLLENGMRPTLLHTMYSLRHSFKDRLKSVLTPVEMIDELMGHKIDKPEYGEGYELRLKLQFMQQIVYRPGYGVDGAAPSAG